MSRQAAITPARAVNPATNVAVAVAAAHPPERKPSQTDRWLSFLAGHDIRPKLSISDPSDADEREADTVAERLMRMPARGENPPPISAAGTGLIRRACASCAAEDDKHRLARKTAGPSDISQRAARAATDAVAAEGLTLGPAERNFFERRLGRDLRSVRIHHGETASRAAAGIGALAYTHGRHIAFAAGQYRPDTDRGRRLLAHELVHVLQNDRDAAGSQSLRRQVPGTGMENNVDPMDDPRMHPPGAPNAHDCGRPSWCPETFCKPWDNESRARQHLAKMRLPLMAGIAVAVGYRAAGVWATYLDGGAALQDFTGQFGDDFAKSPHTAEATTFLVGAIKAKLRANPPTIPATATEVDIDVGTLIPAELKEINTAGAPHEMNFSKPRDIAGNLAGGIGDNQASCPAGAKPSPINDERKVKGVLTVKKQPSGAGILATPKLEYLVQDTVDLCPGDCGSDFEQLATVTMSQFEATGIAGDVPYTVKFPAKTEPFLL